MPSLSQIAHGNAGDLAAALSASARSLDSSAAVRAARGEPLCQGAPAFDAGRVAEGRADRPRAGTREASMLAGTFKALLGTAAALALLAACSGNPNPRGSAYSGVSSNVDRSTLNSPYYTGADPSFRPRSGGSN